MVGDHMGIPRTVVFVAAIVSFFLVAFAGQAGMRFCSCGHAKLCYRVVDLPMLKPFVTTVLVGRSMARMLGPEPSVSGRSSFKTLFGGVTCRWRLL
jgi:hypothetical protein